MRRFFLLLITSSLVATCLLTIASTAAVGDDAATVSPSPDVTTQADPQSKTQSDTFAIGEIGPAGGVVFYVNKKGFKCGEKFTSTGSPTGGLCHYLEVAPNGWNTGIDPRKLWAVKSKQSKDVAGVAGGGPEVRITPESTRIVNSSSEIGLGYKNSIAIVKQGNDTTTAAGASRAYQGGSMSDWYLPTLTELNQLCKWARGVPWKSDATVCAGGKLNSPTYGAGSIGLIETGYFSSSERLAKTVWHQFFSDFTRQWFEYKASSEYIRPIRAF
ncbi:unannotated protein [freshwater metagenome]|uniref:Unannotated protein n=1 Tax=freshwater metagenome TaxID=449393 RepID=A0A6J7IWG9_9ZZZZ|nr:hypothetical protein [Actinomycetota bacterium]